MTHYFLPLKIKVGTDPPPGQPPPPPIGTLSPKYEIFFGWHPLIYPTGQDNVSLASSNCRGVGEIIHLFQCPQDILPGNVKLLINSRKCDKSKTVPEFVIE